MKYRNLRDNQELNIQESDLGHGEGVKKTHS